VRLAALVLCLSPAALGQDLPPYRNDDLDRQLPPEPDYRNVLARLDFLGAERCSANVAAQWAYETNVNDFTQLQAVSDGFVGAKEIRFAIILHGHFIPTRFQTPHFSNFPVPIPSNLGTFRKRVPACAPMTQFGCQIVTNYHWPFVSGARRRGKIIAVCESIGERFALSTFH